MDTARTRTQLALALQKLLIIYSSPHEIGLFATRSKE
jgi:hypothetical protein